MAKVYEVLARAFAAEETEACFTLMGDANMYFVEALVRNHGVRAYHVRHEHAAVGMAAGYARSTGRVGVASVTNGPGIPQIITELTVAAQAQLPLVVFAGDTPLHSPWNAHTFDQRSVTLPTGAAFIAVHSQARMLRDIREAFYIARYERRPVVVSVPTDLQGQEFAGTFDYDPSLRLIPRFRPFAPNPEAVDEAVEMILAAERPIIIGGRGAVQALEEVTALADHAGALLSTTMVAKGLYDGLDFDLGIAGGLSNNKAYDLFKQSDLIIGFGAGLGFHTSDQGRLYPRAKVIQVDIRPRGMVQGRPVADYHVQGDSGLTAKLMLERLAARMPKRIGWRTDDLRDGLAQASPDVRVYEVQPGTVDPRAAVRELDRVVPKDYDILCGPGHYMGHVLMTLRGRGAGRYHPVTEFGAIGSALPQAMGMAAARGDGKVLLIDGDGSIMLHLQEFDTIMRSGLKLLICILNDGGYGAEFHKLRSEGMDPGGTIHGRGPLTEITRAFGMDGETVTELGRFEALYASHLASPRSALWNIHISDNIPTVNYRRLHYGER